MKKFLLAVCLSFFLIFSTNANFEEKVLDYKISSSYSWIEQFYKDNLNSEQIKEIKNIYDKYEETYLKNIWKDWWIYKYNLLKNLEYLFNSTKKYVDESKKDDFFKYIVNNQKVEIKTNKYKWVWFTRVETTYYIDLEKKYRIIKKKFFWEKFRKKISDILNNIPEEKREKIINHFIERIDLIIEKTNSEIKIAKLKELKEIIIDCRDNIDVDNILDIENLIK